jgi:hypothetical protein
VGESVLVLDQLQQIRRLLERQTQMQEDQILAWRAARAEDVAVRDLMVAENSRQAKFHEDRIEEIRSMERERAAKEELWKVLIKEEQP